MYKTTTHTTQNYLAENVNTDKIETTCFIATVIRARLETGKLSAKMLLLVSRWELRGSKLDCKPKRRGSRMSVPPCFKWFAPKYKMSIKDKGIVLPWIARYRITFRRRVG